MANKRQLVKRRKAVRNIRKITRTMQLIATARYQAAYRRALAAKPYNEKLTELVRSLSGVDVVPTGSLLTPHSDAKRSATVVISSQRGLCGGYNGNVLRQAIGHLDDQAGQGIENDVCMVGRKGDLYFKFLRRPVSKAILDLSDAPSFDEIEPIANDLLARFRSGEITSAYVVYMKFISAGKQQPEARQLLPLGSDDGDAQEQSGGSATVQYEFSPEPAELLKELLPAVFRARLFQCFTDSVASEQVARMVAMKAATDAAGDMITALSRRCNRARQSQITMELLDIIGGASALG